MAEDVLQSAYLKVLEGKAVFDGRSSFKTWLFAVIRNTALAARRQLLNRLGAFTAKFWNPALSEGGSEFSFYQSEIRVRMEKMLSTLSARQREILQLVFYHDLTIEESARVMGVSVGSARTHYQRGKEHLRAQMEKAGMRK